MFTPAVLALGRSSKYRRMINEVPRWTNVMIPPRAWQYGLVSHSQAFYDKKEGTSWFNWCQSSLSSLYAGK